MRPLTEQQFRRLAKLGNGAMLVSGNKRDWESLYKRGLIEGEIDARWLQGVTITPEGLRALADGLERYGWRKPVRRGA